MKHGRSIRTSCLAFVLSLAVVVASAAPHGQQQNSPSSAEYKAYQSAHDEKDTQAKIKLLNDFAVKYPDSVLTLYVYQDYYVAYFLAMDYPLAAAYADRVLLLGDKADVDSRILALETREIAYSLGCRDSTFQTPDASAKARDTAKQGLQMLKEWTKPEELTDEQFAAEKTSIGIILNSVGGDAESRLKGDRLICYSPEPSQLPRPDPGRFDRMIDGILSEQRQAPRVR